MGASQRMQGVAAIGLALGLALGLPPVAARAQATVVVQPGDTLSAIARRHGSTAAALAAANGLASPDLIYPGQQLRLPGAAAGPGGGASGGAAGAPRATAPGLHVVRPGETLYHIALRYGSTIGQLVALNHLTSANRIYAGQRLAVPQPLGVGGPALPPPSAGGGAGRRIVVSLGDQTLTAYQGEAVAASFPISSGRSWTPTPVGRFRITSRYRSQRMVGPGYDLPGVPYVQYFVGNYALHGAYWHNLFGTPTSHGCVNLRVEDAAWLWGWAGIGTEVLVRR